jgi:hypothetical protein
MPDTTVRGLAGGARHYAGGDGPAPERRRRMSAKRKRFRTANISNERPTKTSCTQTISKPAYWPAAISAVRSVRAISRIRESEIGVGLRQD